MKITNEHICEKLKEILGELADERLVTKHTLDLYWQRINALQVLSQIEISSIDFKGAPSPLDESVTIKNRGEMTTDISGWQLMAGSPDQTFTFPEGSYLSPYEEIRIHTSDNHPFSFCSPHPIWNNFGDCGELRTSAGDLVSRYVYGRKAHTCIMISDIFFDGTEYRAEGDEYVEIVNTSPDIADISDWQLRAQRNGKQFIFPEHTLMQPNATFRVYTNKTPSAENAFSFNSPTAIWNNQSGGCILLDNADQEVSSYQY